jgi:hypothetical protein
MLETLRITPEANGSTLMEKHEKIAQPKQRYFIDKNKYL